MCIPSLSAVFSFPLCFFASGTPPEHNNAVARRSPLRSPRRRPRLFRAEAAAGSPGSRRRRPRSQQRLCCSDDDDGRRRPCPGRVRRCRRPGAFFDLKMDERAYTRLGEFQCGLDRPSKFFGIEEEEEAEKERKRRSVSLIIIRKCSSLPLSSSLSPRQSPATFLSR